MKKTYKIEVDCANCANLMEEAAKNTPGVADATVNFMALKMKVEFEDGAEVNIAALVESGLISNPRDGVKILGNGEITKKLNVKVTAASESAKAKIEAAGGTIEVV